MILRDLKYANFAESNTPKSLRDSQTRLKDNLMPFKCNEILVLTGGIRVYGNISGTGRDFSEHDPLVLAYKSANYIV